MSITLNATRTNSYGARCARCTQYVPAGAGILTGSRAVGWTTTHNGECPAAPVAPVAPVAGLDLTPLKAFTSRGIVRVSVPGGDTRLKLRVNFSRGGTVYVDDAAVYGEGNHYGRQAAGQTYRGKVSDALAAIMRDPRAAIVRYTELTGQCGVCGRALEASDSVARGIGPVCAGKLGI